MGVAGQGQDAPDLPCLSSLLTTGQQVEGPNGKETRTALLYWNVQLHMQHQDFQTAEVIPRSLRIEFCSNLISISKNLGSESKRTFQQSRKNRVKGERMVAVHIRPSRGVPPTTSRPATSTRHFFQTCQTRSTPPSFRTAPYPCARPRGGCLASPAFPNPITHTFILCQGCSACSQTTPGRVWRTPPAITFQPTNSISLCTWLLPSLCPAPFCWCHCLHLQQLF